MLAGELNRVFSETLAALLMLAALGRIKKQFFSVSCFFSFVCRSAVPLNPSSYASAAAVAADAASTSSPDRFAMQRSSAASYWFYKAGVYGHVGAPPSVIWLWAARQKSPSRRRTRTCSASAGPPLLLLHLSDLAEIRSRWRISLVPSGQQERR